MPDQTFTAYSVLYFDGQTFEECEIKHVFHDQATREASRLWDRHYGVRVVEVTVCSRTGDPLQHSQPR